MKKNVFCSWLLLSLFAGSTAFVSALWSKRTTVKNMYRMHITQGAEGIKVVMTG